MHKGHTVFSLGKASFVDLSKCTGGGGVGREERDLIVSWFSDEYHHSRNCKKKMPTDTPVERETAAPPSALAKKEVIFPTTLVLVGDLLLEVDLCSKLCKSAGVRFPKQTPAARSSGE